MNRGTRPLARPLAAGFLATGLLLLNGCLFGGHSNVKRDGNYVAESTLGQIETGKTAAGWVKGVLGDPSEKVVINDNEELWKYSYTETRDSGGYVFLIFSTHDKKIDDKKVYIQFKDKIVTKCWRG